MNAPTTIKPATPLPHLTAMGLFISYTGSFGAQRVAECSEEYAAAEIARRTNAYPQLVAERDEMERTAMECVAMNERQARNFAKCQAERAELVAALRLGRGAEDHLKRQALLAKLGAE